MYLLPNTLVVMGEPICAKPQRQPLQGIFLALPVRQHSAMAAERKP